MKKLLILFVFAVSLLALTSCALTDLTTEEAPPKTVASPGGLPDDFIQDVYADIHGGTGCDKLSLQILKPGQTAEAPASSVVLTVAIVSSARGYTTVVNQTVANGVKAGVRYQFACAMLTPPRF